MPGMNGTGPMGQGPMTGRGMGVCQGYGLGKGIGQGLGCRRGIDRGMGRGVRFKKSSRIDLNPKGADSILGE